MMEQQHLHLLVHDLDLLPRRRWPIRRSLVLRRGRAADEPAIMALDDDAFEPPWRLGVGGLEHAVQATPVARYRVATAGPAGAVVGYAVSGVAGRRGYLQRLAVAPWARQRGIGSELVLDALAWMRRRWADEAVVNTQAGNDAALALYSNLGFRLVETRPLDTGALDTGAAADGFARRGTDAR